LIIAGIISQHAFAFAGGSGIYEDRIEAKQVLNRSAAAVAAGALTDSKRGFGRRGRTRTYDPQLRR
jgi:hypothetical protein